MAPRPPSHPLPPTAPLSSKLAITAAHGFALTRSNEPHYRFEWHQHDCAMLLWTQIGALDSRWADAGHEDLAAARSLRLVRRTALLLPAHAAHSTRTDAPRQRHGELYLRPELLGLQRRWGAFQLDDAALAMLDALAAPALAPASAEPLLHALLAQLDAIDAAQWLTLDAARGGGGEGGGALSRRMMQCFERALDLELPLPAVEAVADELGVSMRRLQRACASELGASPVTLRRRLLAARARELLARGVEAARVAERLGFTHSGHLNRLLRDIDG